ncbi:probable G-protein coupled receptor 139 [Stegostoma tigrinum]|uniref:probable G-protein coupled receptor 139 n=1 Tax=Stegostoma tigrinum TaxID=3053191 RepID=UPI00286FF885|nr:probable G-protein coupled receptor 139 [Stegostoma tigrinum]
MVDRCQDIGGEGVYTVTLSNLLAIVILSRGKCGICKGSSIYLISMATADLLVIVYNIILITLAFKYFPVSFLFYTAVCRINIAMGYATKDCSVWLTIAFTIDRYVAICCHSLRARYCTEKTAASAVCIVCFVSILRNIPFLFRYQSVGTWYGVPWGCDLKLEFFTLPGWVAFFWIHHLLNPLIPYLLILLFNALTVRHIVLANRARRGLRARSNRDQRGDAEMVNRRKSIILLFVVSGSFILLWMTKISVFLLMEITNDHFYLNYDHPVAIADISGTVLFYLSSCTNTTLYALTQSKFREELTRALKYPFTLISERIPALK